MQSVILYGQTQKSMEFYPLKYQWSVGGSAGVMMFWGDISEFDNPWEKDMEEYELAYGLSLNKALTPLFHLRLQGIHGNISGIRQYFSSGSEANQQFTSEIWDVNAVGRIYFKRFFNPQLHKIEFYGFGGIGQIIFRSKAENYKTNEIIYSVGYGEDGKKTAMKNDLVYPVGLGTSISLTDKLSTNLEFSYRFQNSDYLDARKGLTDVKDMYGYTSIGIVYNLGFKEKPGHRTHRHTDDYSDDTNYDDAYDYNYDDTQYITDTTAVTDTHVDVETSDTSTYTDNNYIPDTDNTDWQTKDTYNYDTTTTINDNTNVVPVYDNTNVVDNNTVYNNDTYTPDNSSNGLTYRVQVIASYNKPIDYNSFANKYNITQPIREEKIGNWYKYTVGDLTDKNEAKALRKEMLNKGVAGVFIAPYNFGTRIEPQEAENILKNKTSYTSNDFVDAKTVVATSGNSEITRTKVFYSVQIAASRNALDKSFIQKFFGINQPIFTDYVDGWHKYSVGIFTNYQDAYNYKMSLSKDKSFKGTFIIAYFNNKRITPQEAKLILEKQ